MAAHSTSTKHIWKTFFILLIITTVEVGLGMYNSANPGDMNWTILKWAFIIMTIWKAYFIVVDFMHVGSEEKSLKLTLALPMIILIPYLLFIILNEAIYVHGTLH